MSLVVTVYVKVPWRPLRAWVMFTGMEHAFTESSLHHDFERGGRRYRWVEGVLHPAAARFRGRRGELGALFTRTVMPTLLRRDAVRAQHPATDDGRAWWVTLRREGEATVWALYVSTRGLSRAVTQTRGAPRQRRRAARSLGRRTGARVVQRRARPARAGARGAAQPPDLSRRGRVLGRRDLRGAGHRGLTRAPTWRTSAALAVIPLAPTSLTLRGAP